MSVEEMQRVPIIKTGERERNERTRRRKKKKEERRRKKKKKKWATTMLKSAYIIFGKSYVSACSCVSVEEWFERHRQVGRGRVGG